MLRKLNFTARIFLVTTALVIVALGVAAAATYIRGNQIAATSAEDSLEHSREIQQNVETLRLQRLKLMSELVSTDPSFVGYVLESTTSNDPFAGGQASNGSVKDLLSERKDQVGYDLGLVLNPAGQPLAQVGGTSQVQATMDSNPAVAGATKTQRETTGYWLQDGHVYQIAVAPLANRDQLAGYLVLGLELDQAQLLQMARVSGSELAIIDTSSGSDAPVAATLKPDLLPELTRALGNRHDVSVDQFPLTLGGGHWLAHAETLQPGVVALTLTSLDQALAGYRAIFTTLIIAALFATLLALALSGWLSGRVAQPLRQLASAAQAAARGDYKHQLPVQSGAGEIAQVTQAVDSLLSDLREKEEIEKYMTDLAKYQNEDETGVVNATEPTPPSAVNEQVFLALSTPESLSPATQAPEAYRAFDDMLRDAEAPVRRQGGRLAATTDRSAILMFANLESAYIAAGDILHRASELKRTVSAALVAGSTTAARVEWTTGQRAATVGIPVQRLEDLLRSAPPGSLVTTAELATKAKMLLAAVATPLPDTAAMRGAATLGLPPRSETITQTVVVDGKGAPRPTPGGPTRSAPIRLEPGAILGGRYEIIAEIGSGGMGVVYKVRDRQLEQIVALKTIRADSLQDPELLDNVKSEIRLSRQITHRNVVRIYDLGEVAGLPFISMEYVRGMTLRYMLQKRERIPVSAGLRVMRQVCAALQAAHEQGILHRDVKADNIMLEPTGNAKLMDFGIAGQVRLDGGAGKDRVIMGTPAYAAPEQLQGAPMDERADIYACGVLMYRMFTGKLPFDDRQLDKMIAKKQKGDFRPASALASDLPAELDALINDCLKGNSEHRVHGAEALLDRLEGIRI